MRNAIQPDKRVRARLGRRSVHQSHRTPDPGHRASPPLNVDRESAVVSTLCVCILGIGVGQAKWPPTSVHELFADCAKPTRKVAPEAMSPNRPHLIGDGLAALDHAAATEFGLTFDALAHVDQLRLLSTLERGDLTLSRCDADAFLDILLTLAVHTYLAADPTLGVLRERNVRAQS